MLMNAKLVILMRRKTKWYVNESEISGEPAYSAQLKFKADKKSLDRGIRTCGGFSRDRESVKKLVDALNERERNK